MNQFKSSENRPSVLHVHYWADIRNSAGSVEKVITSFASSGHTFQHLIACCDPSPATSRDPFEYLGIQVFPFKENTWINRVFNKWLGLNKFSYPSLVHLINRLRPSILHFHNRQELVDEVLARLDYRPTVVVHYHRHFRKPDVPRRADLLLFPSRATERYIREKTGTGKPCAVVHNPLSLEVLRYSQPRETQRGDGLPMILFGGGNNPIKGLHELIEAFSRLPTGSARLVLAGRGVEHLDIHHPMIEALGEIPAPAFFHLMAEADIVTMPSYEEPFGLIAQEAMLLGKLMVVSNSGGLAEFTDEECAVICLPKNVSSLADALARALSYLDDERSARLIQRAFERVQSLAPEKMANVLENAYKNARAKEA